ncbi:hypothetical protein JH06_0081 [Blastocystis sp. subtype 4]|uniref:hypothetical protein n=1 Tax=Blastocystis sp. subtype 4 TaxID=944170 RepID=UPI0007119BF8|nr:hypothetical protein JH06_0081 [Blastocystis sp. subtype 4]KNB46549.1 hypothetical protein JH06_0081 [Blastocystis sp. subtype 4]|eukprot:XP_014529992.1 hypothetical protein JH06_0081 [Blastocystis sp. subtype 4]
MAETVASTDSTLKTGLLESPGTYITTKYSEFKTSDIRHLLSFLRWTNLLTSFVVCTFTILTSISYLLNFNISTFLLSAYCCLFSGILFLFELHTKRINNRFKAEYGFLFTYIGRSVFILFLSTLLFSIPTFVQKIFGLVVLGISVMNLFVIVVHPAFRRHEISLLDDPSITYTAGESVSVMDELKNIVVNNPDIAQKVITEAAKLTTA